MRLTEEQLNHQQLTGNCVFQCRCQKAIKYLETDDCLAGQSESTADRGGDVQSDGDLQAVQNYPRSVSRPRNPNPGPSNQPVLPSFYDQLHD